MCPIRFNNKQADDVAEEEPVRGQVIKGRSESYGWAGGLCRVCRASYTKVRT